MNQLNLFPNQQPAYKEGDVVNGKRVVRTKHGDLQLVPITGKTKAYYVEQARQLWGDKYDYTDSVYVENKKPIIIYCPKHDYHFRVAMAQNHILKPNGTFRPTGCPICEYERKYGGDFGLEWRDTLKLSANSNRVGLIVNTGKPKLSEKEKARRRAERDAATAERRQKRKEERRKAYEERMRLQHEETLRRQEERKAERKRQTEEKEQQRIKELQEMFLREAPKAQGEGYQYRGVEKIRRTKDHVEVHCPNPDHEWHPMLVSLILQGCKCRECAGRHVPLEERRAKFVKDFHKRHGHEHYDVMAEDYVNNDTPIRVRCKIHNYDFMTSPDNILRGGGGCPYCTASEGEATILGWLDNHKEEYTWHYAMPNEDPTLPLQYIEADFYLPDVGRQPMVIEYHGEQHYKYVPHFYKGKRVRSFEIQKQRDRYLRKYCSEHHIRLLEIPYWDLNNIDTILQETMKKYRE